MALYIRNWGRGTRLNHLQALKTAPKTLKRNCKTGMTTFFRDYEICFASSQSQISKP
jgi:hypothetical protein